MIPYEGRCYNYKCDNWLKPIRGHYWRRQDAHCMTLICNKCGDPLEVTTVFVAGVPIYFDELDHPEE